MNFRKWRTFFGMSWNIVLVTGIVCTSVSIAQKNNLGIGIYPGNPKENFSPSIRYDSKTYKNIALLKPVYSSGSYDFCLTPQLLTDGIIETQMPGWIISSSSDKVYSRSDREIFIDRNVSSRKEFEGKSLWIQIEQAGILYYLL